jgi:N-methylhydantoinase A
VRLAVDTGGTFTDLVVEGDDGVRRLYKSSTTPLDPIEGVLNVIALAAADRSCSRAELLGEAELLIYATTRAINAVLTGTAARTALLTTEGHPEILVFREGGRTQPFNHRRVYPPPYIPRRFTWEVPGRIDSRGRVLRPLDEAALVDIIEQLSLNEIEAVAVCLLWATANPIHERRVGELLADRLPNTPHTLSHELNPTIREYRRASATAIDASLKPVMTAHLAALEERLRDAGLRTPVVIVTSSGGVMEASAVAQAPIHVIMSGPAMAPLAGRHYASTDTRADTAIVTDTGGTSYDVSLVHRGRIPRTRETWLGPRFLGHMTGFPAVDVRSIGAGGGSIAWVDEGGLLHVGPQSAGADPGPACYGRGGTQATVTDAALVLGYLDPTNFLGGAMPLDVAAAYEAIERCLGVALGLDPRAAAAAVIEVTTEQMVHAIEEITVNQGIDPRTAVLIGGGGAAGLNGVAVSRRLSGSAVLFPSVGAALSAAGALVSDLVAEFAASLPTSSADFSQDRVNEVLSSLAASANAFLKSAAHARVGTGRIEYSAEARYRHQVWELELPLRRSRFAGPADVSELVTDFDELHREVFEVNDPGCPVEILTWRVRASHALSSAPRRESAGATMVAQPSARAVYFQETGIIPQASVVPASALDSEQALQGPAIVDAPLTTIVVPPGCVARRAATGGVIITVGGHADGFST